MASLDHLIATAETAADRAGPILRAAFRTSPASDDKPDRSPVTHADREAERAIRQALAAADGGRPILGEEYGANGAPGDTLWIIDPIDGTRAFITGRPTFTTLLAFVEDGVPILGVIDQPATGERWIGVRGRPTRFRGPFGGIPRTRWCAGLDAAELSATAPDIFGDARSRFERLAGAVRRTSWGGDAYAYGLLALGQIDVIAEATMKPWDWAALVPVVEGAGGAIGDWQGRPLRLDGTGEVLAAGDAALRAACVALLRPAHEEVTDMEHRGDV